MEDRKEDQKTNRFNRYDTVYRQLVYIRNCLTQRPPQTESAAECLMKGVSRAAIMYANAPPEWRKQNPFDVVSLIVDARRYAKGHGDFSRSR